MADVVDRATRSQMMSGIRGKDTKPEFTIRKGLHRLGYRFRVHVSTLPGKPDVCFRKHNAIIFVNGCFWHGHSCHLFKWPETRADFWKQKINRNCAIDARNLHELTILGWRVLIIWECALKGKHRQDLGAVLRMATKFLNSQKEFAEIRGVGYYEHK